MNKKLLLPFLLLIAYSVKAQQKVIQLYNGAAPGSETWDWNQKESADNVYHSNVVYNVSHPTLTVYLPDSGVVNTGAAVIICPGGGLQTLSINHEGYEVGKWLQKHGVTAFLLEYRLMHTLGPDPYKEMLAKMKANTVLQEQAPVAPLAVADGRAAIAYVRNHAAEYGISPSRIGIIGFSAGGTIAASTAYGYTKQNRPDFVAPVYAYFPPEMQVNVPADAPPMFIAAAGDDASSIYSVQLYNTWFNSKHPAELHIFLNGGHGFGMKKQNLASDSWADLFENWMKLSGFLKPL
jgi:dienelactone hydrolase